MGSIPAHSEDVWCVAEALICQFGVDAAVRAWHEIQVSQQQDELEQVLFWIDVLTAVLEWHRSQPIEGEMVH